MADIFAEVDEAMRQERMMALWKQYRVLIIGGIAALIIGTGSWSFYSDWRESTNQHSTSQMLALLEDSDSVTNVTLEQIEAIESPALQAITALNVSGELLGDDKAQDAIPFFEFVAQQKKAPDTLQQIAQSALVKLQTQENAEQDAIESLAMISKDKNSPVRAYAMLDSAVFLAAQGDYMLAVGILDEIIGTAGLPATIYTRSNSLKHVYNSKYNISPSVSESTQTTDAQ